MTKILKDNSRIKDGKVSYLGKGSESPKHREKVKTVNEDSEYMKNDRDSESVQVIMQHKSGKQKDADDAKSELVEGIRQHNSGNDYFPQIFQT